jgi:hypothetical protein
MASGRVRSTAGRATLVIGAALILVLGFDYVTFAATGSSLIIGHLNRAGHTTTIQNTGAGPALSLKTKSGASAPFAVNGKGKVTNLNADRLDGLDSTQLQRRLGVCADGTAVTNAAATGAVTCGQLPRTQVWTLAASAPITGVAHLDAYTASYPAGSYLVTGNFATSALTGTGAIPLGCRLFSVGPTNHADFHAFAGQQAIAASTGSNYVSVSGSITLTTARQLNLYCFGPTTMTVDPAATSLTVIRLDGGSTGTLTTDP